MAFSLCITSISLAQSEEEWEKLLENSDAGKKLLDNQQKRETNQLPKNEKRTASGCIDTHCHLIIPDISNMGRGIGQGGSMGPGAGMIPGVGMRGGMGKGTGGSSAGRSSQMQQRNENSFNSIASLLKQLPNDLAQKVAHNNAVELYKLK